MLALTVSCRGAVSEPSTLVYLLGQYLKCPVSSLLWPRPTDMGDDEDLPINVDPNITPNAPEHEQPTIGLIGMGAMGRMYAKLFSQAGWKKCVILVVTRINRRPRFIRIYVCDIPERYERLKEEYASTPLDLFRISEFSSPRLVDRHPWSPSSTKWIRRIQVCRLHHIFRRGGIHRPCGCTVWSL